MVLSQNISGHLTHLRAGKEPGLMGWGITDASLKQLAYFSDIQAQTT